MRKALIPVIIGLMALVAACGNSNGSASPSGPVLESPAASPLTSPLESGSPLDSGSGLPLVSPSAS